MKEIIVLNKKEGETPLEALEDFRAKNKKYKDVKMTYAGRLDPMASGLLLVLIGEETKNKEKYLKLDKKYEFEILFGAASDTYDILGKIKHSDILKNVGMSEVEKSIKKNLKFFKGKFVQKYPIYSSKTVKGKQLFEYGRAGEEVEQPEQIVEVKSLKFQGLRKTSSKVLFKNIERRIKKVKGDFRQPEILSAWSTLLCTSAWKRGYIGKFKARVGSGAYIRGIAHSLGEKIGVPALAFSIKRTQIGKYKRGV